MLRKETGSTPARAKVCLRAAPGRTIAVPVTVEIPAEQMTIHAAPPGLITRRNADYLGLTGDELVRIVRAMSRDPRFADQVVKFGKSLRSAPPDSILAYLRSAPLRPLGRTMQSRTPKATSTRIYSRPLDTSAQTRAKSAAR
jgi:hypothetical protein